MTDLTATRQRLLDQFTAALDTYTTAWSSWPAGVVEPARWVLFGGGKRIRPVLAMMAAEAVGGEAKAAVPWGIAIEMIHSYSLAHDDLPALDDDDERRGRPTCHVQFDEAHAVLAGDTLLTEAFAVLAQADWPADRAVQLVGMLARAAGGGGMIGGQVLDIGGALDTLDALEHMLSLKTGALIRAAAVGGAIAAGGRPEHVAAIAAYGEAIGLLFQITDDLLDRQQDPTEDGKNVLDVLDFDAAIVRRDAVAAKARSSVALLGESSATLVALVDAIAVRTH